MPLRGIPPYDSDDSNRSDDSDDGNRSDGSDGSDDGWAVLSIVVTRA